MSTTDTRAAFEVWWKQSHNVNQPLTIESVAWMVWQAATEAAKATGTAGELLALPEPSFMWRHEDACGSEVGPADPYYTLDQMRTYGQACADIARHQSSQSLMMETIQRATAESGLTRMEQCCGDPLKYCATDQWKGNLEGFAKALLRLNASVFAGARQPVPVAAQENGGLVRAALIDLMEIEQAATAGEFKQDMTFDFAKQSHYRALFARARAALAATAAPVLPRDLRIEIGRFLTDLGECAVIGARMTIGEDRVKELKTIMQTILSVTRSQP